MKGQKQKIVDTNIGDCFRACMASLLELPIDVLPNDHSPAWFGNWLKFLDQFGLGLCSSANPDGPIWATEPWIATVKSKNFEGGTHAILMHHGGIVLFDPSTKKRYRTGESLLGKKIVSGAYHLTVTDAGALYHLKEYQKQLSKKV